MNLRWPPFRRVVLLSTGAVVNGNLDNYVVRFNVVSEAAVRDSALDWTVLRPSGFMSNALRWPPQLKEGDTVREPFGDIPVALIDPFDIGAVAARALTEPGHAGHSYRLTGPQALLPAERLAILSRVLGRELRLVALPDDEARREMSASMPERLVDAFFEFSRGGTYRDDQVTGTTAELLGQPSRTFAGWASGRGRCMYKSSQLITLWCTPMLLQAVFVDRLRFRQVIQDRVPLDVGGLAGVFGLMACHADPVNRAEDSTHRRTELCLHGVHDRQVPAGCRGT